MLLSLSSLVTTLSLGSALTGGAPAPAIVADSMPFDTAQVVVTTNDFSSLSTFLTATSQEWSKPKVQNLMKKHYVTYDVAFGDVGGASVPAQLKKVPIPNYALIADSVPEVAKGLAQAKLTGARYMQLSRTLNCAYMTDQIDRLSHGGTAKGTDSTSVTGKNIAFIHAHQSDFDKLVQQLLDVNKLQGGGGGGGGMGGGDDDLSP